MNNIAVILGVNYYIGLSIIRCLGKMNIYTVGIDYSYDNAYGFKSKYLSEKLIAPHYKKNEKDFIKFLVDYAKKQNEKPVLYPSADPYVEVINNNIVELSKYYLIPITTKDFYTNIMDKDTLFNIAVENNMLVPETIFIDEDSFYERVKKELSYPCILKPVDSPAFMKVFRKKMFKVYNESELKEAINKSKEHNLAVITQRIIPGFDDHMYTFDVHLNQNSKVTHYMTCQKFRQYPINFGASVYTKQIYVPEIVTIGTKFLEDINYKGFAEIEFKKDEISGNYYLIEINVRTTTLNCLLDKAGINFPYILYKELTGENINTNFMVDSTNMYFCYAFEDVLAIKDYLKTKQLTFSKIISSIFTKKIYAIWSITDTKPYFYYMKNLILKLFKHIKRRS